MEDDLFGDGTPENSDVFSNICPPALPTAAQNLENFSGSQEDDDKCTSNQYDTGQISGGLQDGLKEDEREDSLKQTSEDEAAVVEKPWIDPVVGIDLGTTFSCVAVWEKGRPVVVANNMGNRTTPSWVCFHKDGTFVGEAARSKGTRFPKLAIFDAKRMIGRKITDPSIQECTKSWPFDTVSYKSCCAVQIDSDSEKRVIPPEEISAHVLVKMKQTAEDYLGQKVLRAVVTVPAYFNDAQRQATIDACTIAGLTVERIINEPTAAALAYGLEKDVGEGKARTLLIYDLGGGTLDVTVLVVEGGVFEVKSTSGDTQLGGQDFDNQLVAHFLPEVQEKCGEDISNNPKALRKLRDACQTLKHSLSHSESSTLEVDALVNGEDFDSSMTRDKFVEINQNLFSRCMKPVELALKDAGIAATDIDEVVLIGGSTRIVKVQELLERYFTSIPLSKRINPDEAVALGACIQAANLSLTFDQKLSDKLSGLTLMDVTPLSLGIELANRKMSILIQRNTTIPYSHTRVYKNNDDYQTEAIIEVYEGEEKKARNNRLLGKFTVPGIPPKLRGEVSIPVTFSIDANGVLEVTACVSGLASSTTQKLVIQKDKGLLTEQDIETIRGKVSNWEQKCRELKLN